MNNNKFGLIALLLVVVILLGEFSILPLSIATINRLVFPVFLIFAALWVYDLIRKPKATNAQTSQSTNISSLNPNTYSIYKKRFMILGCLALPLILLSLFSKLHTSEPPNGVSESIPIWALLWPLFLLEAIALMAVLKYGLGLIFRAPNSTLEKTLVGLGLISMGSLLFVSFS